MADMSRLVYAAQPPAIPGEVFRERMRESMRENITFEGSLALRDRLLDAEQMWRYFCRRDEMNAEVHLVDGTEAKVRYSPITIAAERVCGYLSQLYYGDPSAFLTAIHPEESDSPIPA